MKKIIALVLSVLFLSVAGPACSQTRSTAPDGAAIVNFSNSDMNASYHAQVVITPRDNDYITLINRYGNAFAWGFVEYDGYGNKYLYVSDNGYNYYYCGPY